MYVPEPQLLNLFSVSQSTESALVKDLTAKSSVRHDNSAEIPKSIVIQNKSVDAKTTNRGS